MKPRCPPSRALRPLVIASLVVAAALSGCASSGVVHVVGTDTYVAKKEFGAAGLGYPRALLADLHRDSEAFCLRIGRVAETVKETQIAGKPFERTAAAELRFRCVAA